MEVYRILPSVHYILYDIDLRATHARTLLPAALASVSFGFVLVRVRVRVHRSGRVLNIGDYYGPVTERFSFSNCETFSSPVLVV